MTARGIRNYNPGNLDMGEEWQGLAPIQTDPRFCTFISMAYGVRALCKVLLTYQNKYGLFTPKQIIGRWAPPNENDTPAYYTAVAHSMGVGTDSALHLKDPLTLARLARAIINHENGADGRIVSDADIRQGVTLALA